MWFSGVHTNVGGGYCEDGLSNISLAWLVSKAVEAKLPAGESYIRGWTQENAKGQLRDSYSEFQNQLGLVGRLADFFHINKIQRAILDTQRIHTTVFDRIAAFKNLNPSYRPAAKLQNGGSLPDDPKTLDQQRIVETPNYLASVLPPVNHA